MKTLLLLSNQIAYQPKLHSQSLLLPTCLVPSALPNPFAAASYGKSPSPAPFPQPFPYSPQSTCSPFSAISRKIPWRLSSHQKRRQRKRLRLVDNVIATIDTALAKKGETSKAVERWKMEMPREEEMLPKDKYTVFDRKEKKYRKGIHSEFLFGRISLVLDGGVWEC